MKIGREPLYQMLPDGAYLFFGKGNIRFGYRASDWSWRCQIDRRLTPIIEIFRPGYMKRELEMSPDIVTSYTHRCVLGFIYLHIYALGDGEEITLPPCKEIPGTGAPDIPGKVSPVSPFMFEHPTEK